MPDSYRIKVLYQERIYSKFCNMERNNIRAALQMDDFFKCEEAWKESDFFDGSVDFYTFVTTPTPERDEYFVRSNVSIDFNGAVMITKL